MSFALQKTGALSYLSSSIDDTNVLAAALAQLVQPQDVLVLTGDLGAGKTHFTKGFTQALGSGAAVTSPTFTLVQIYEGGRLPVYHFDLYRINSQDQLDDIDFKGLLEQDAVCLVEWGEQFADALPDDYLQVTVEKVSDSETEAVQLRRISFQAKGSSGLRAQELCAALNALDIAEFIAFSGAMGEGKAASTSLMTSSVASPDKAGASSDQSSQPSSETLSQQCEFLAQAQSSFCLHSNQRKGLALAFDSSGEQLVIAVAVVAYHQNQDGNLCLDSCEFVAERSVPAPRRANTELLDQILQLLNELGCTMSELVLVVVSRGPGSFTGVRIAVATAKGIAHSLSVPLLGISTLDAVAQSVYDQGYRKKLLVVNDAMRKEVYPASYELSKGVKRHELPSQLYKAQDFLDYMKTQDISEYALAGDALYKYPEMGELEIAQLCPPELWYPSGKGLIAAFADQYLKCEVSQHHPAYLLPLYTRLSDAEEAERLKLGLKKTAAQNLIGVADELADRHLQFRLMSINDLEQVCALEHLVFDDDPWSYESFEAQLKEALTRSWWVAHDEGSIIGFAGASYAADQAELLDIAVHPNYQRKGIAKRLLKRLSYDMSLRGCSEMFLEVAEENTAARHCYESCQFSTIGSRKDYYGVGKHALLMKASLPLLFEEALADGDEAHATLPLNNYLTQTKERTASERAALAAHRDLILAIESSCDETAAAIIDAEGTILANVIATQIDFHARFGGVVPEIASRKHTEAIVGVIDETLNQAAENLGLSTALRPEELSALAVTQGPGLVGALVVGIAYAKGFAAAHNLPLIAVNHMEGHLFANLLVTPDLQPPFIASLVSGGHTMLVLVKDWGSYEILGQTLDDAVGEAFDKVAKALGFGYPGGPILSRLAKDGDPNAIAFPRALLHSHDYQFSLSGLKTAVVNYIHKENSANRPVHAPNLAASFEAAVIEVQCAKAVRAVRQTKVTEFCLGGGVAANPSLRKALSDSLSAEGVRVTLPPLSACTDNAAMIALVARERYRAGKLADYRLDADPNLSW